MDDALKLALELFETLSVSDQQEIISLAAAALASQQ